MKNSFYLATGYPREAEQAKKETLPVLLPIGTMEYHSTHCPYGCDTLVAQGVCEKVAEKTPAMVLPPVWYGVAIPLQAFFATRMVRGGKLRRGRTGNEYDKRRLRYHGKLRILYPEIPVRQRV